MQEPHGLISGSRIMAESSTLLLLQAYLGVSAKAATPVSSSRKV